jgi:hypothetical protein
MNLHEWRRLDPVTAAEMIAHHWEHQIREGFAMEQIREAAKPEDQRKKAQPSFRHYRQVMDY